MKYIQKNKKIIATGTDEGFLESGLSFERQMISIARYLWFFRNCAFLPRTLLLVKYLILFENQYLIFKSF